MYEHTNPKIKYALNEISNSQKLKVQDLVETFLPEDHDDLLNAFDAGYLEKNSWEEYNRDYPIPARIVMGLALIRLDSPKIRSLLLSDLLSKDKEKDIKDVDKYLNRAFAAIYIAGQGPYENDQDILNALYNLLGSSSWQSVNVSEKFRLFIPVLGTPVSKYSLYELTGFSLVNLGDLSRLEEILFGQLNVKINTTSKDDFIKWVYSINKSATIQALNSIASYDVRKNKDKDRWVPDIAIMISALEAIGEEECIKPLSTLLEQNDPSVRIRALKAIGKIGGESALTIVRKATEDKKLTVRQNAKKILKHLTTT